MHKLFLSAGLALAFMLQACATLQKAMEPKIDITVREQSQKKGRIWVDGATRESDADVIRGNTIIGNLRKFLKENGMEALDLSDADYTLEVFSTGSASFTELVTLSGPTPERTLKLIRLKDKKLIGYATTDVDAGFPKAAQMLLQQVGILPQ